MTRVGTLVFVCLGFFVCVGVFVCLCWPDMVPNQRQLFIVVSDWGSYLGSHFPHLCCGILSMYLCTAVGSRFVRLLFYSVSFDLLKMMWNSTHAEPWSDPYDERDTDRLMDK